jgi:DNA-binding response OmpR family regulator
VINWIEQELLSSYRTPGGHRRIRRDDLLAFLRKHNIPVPPSLTSEQFKILIVEDEDDIVKMLSLLFKRQEVYEVSSSSDGITALIDIGRLHPDLMVLDIMIPGVDGLEVCRRIKDDPTNRTAIIAISGKPEMEAKVLKAGADRFLAKPLDLDKLLEESKRLLRIL